MSTQTLFERGNFMLDFMKLWILLEKRGMKKTDLKQVISSATLAKLGKNEPVSSTVIEKVCGFLECQPGDIMEYISEKDIESIANQIDSANRALMETLKQQGITEEQFASLMQSTMPDIIKSMYAGEDTMTNIFKKSKEELEK